MFAKTLCYSAAFVVAIHLVLLMGCEGDRGPAGPPGSVPVYIEASVWIPHQEIEPAGYVYVKVYNCLGIPGVWINDIAIPYNFNYPGSNAWTGLSFYVEDFRISPGDPASHFMQFTQSNGESGIGISDIVVPDTFQITAPEPPYEITMTDSITFSWTESNWANFYAVDFAFQYSYIIGGNNSNGGTYSHSLDTLLVQNFVIYGPSDLFPNIVEINEVYDIQGTFIVWAINGPFPGELGNIVGGGTGTFHGMTAAWLWINAEGELTSLAHDQGIIPLHDRIIR
jgi:hypothetical protein